MFSPSAWLKLQFFCHVGQTEVGGFGISSQRNPLYIDDFVTVPQHASLFSVRFLDDAVADFFDRCVDGGLAPQQFGRIWCHTHPGASVTPSSVDEETFAGCFGHCDWSLMFILGRTSRTYARLAFGAGPGGRIRLPVGVDWASWPGYLVAESASMSPLIEAWHQEYAAHVQVAPATPIADPNARDLEDAEKSSCRQVVDNPDQLWLDTQYEEDLDAFSWPPY
jgi:hypothetical protein